MPQKIAGWVGWAVVVFVVVATLSPLELRPRIPEIGDGQFLGFAVAGMLFLIAYPRQIVLIALIMVGASILLEASQLIVPGRHGRISDAVVKIAGAISGITIGWLITGYRGRARYRESCDQKQAGARTGNSRLRMRLIFGTVQRKLREDGMIGLMRHIIALPNRQRASRRGGKRSEFDRLAGVETDCVEPLWALDVASENIVHGVRYQPSDPNQVSRDLEALQVQFDDFDFIDLGAGKGRSLIVAAGYPFRRVIGVEFSRRLQEIASANIARLPPERIRCGEIACVYGDAADYEFLARNTVLFLYNPFGDFVMKSVIRNLEATFAHSEWQLCIIYHNPASAKLFDDAAFLHCLSKRSNGALYAMKHLRPIAGEF